MGWCRCSGQDHGDWKDQRRRVGWARGLRVATLGDESIEWQPFLGTCAYNTKSSQHHQALLEGFALRIGLFALLWTRLRLRTLSSRRRRK